MSEPPFEPVDRDTPFDWRERAERLRRLTLQGVSPEQSRAEAREPRKQAELKRHDRPGDPFTPANPEIEELARQVGDSKASWMERLLAMAGVTVGVTQGKTGRRPKEALKPASQRKPFEPGYPHGIAPFSKDSIKSRDEHGFYSQQAEALRHNVEGRKVGTGAQWERWLIGPGKVKAAELDATSMREFLASRGPDGTFAREELLEFADKNKVGLRYSRYGGQDQSLNAPRVEIKTEGTPLLGDDGNMVYRVRAVRGRDSGYPNTGQSGAYTVYHNEATGALKVKDQAGNWLDIQGGDSGRSVGDAWRAITQNMRDLHDYKRPPDTQGKLIWDHRGLNTDVTDRNRELVVKRDLTPRHKEIEARLAELDAQQKDGAGARFSDDHAEYDALRKERFELGQKAYATEAHFPDDSGYLWHNRGSTYQLGMVDGKPDRAGKPAYHFEEGQATLAQKALGAGATPERLAAAEQRRADLIAQERALVDDGISYLKEHYPSYAETLLGDGPPPDARQVADVMRHMGTGGMGPHHAVRVLDGGVVKSLGLPELSPELKQQATDLHNRIEDARRNINQATAEYKAMQKVAVPEHPLTDNRIPISQMVKTALLEAHRQGADSMTSSTGPIQNQRYGLRRPVHAMEVEHALTGTPIEDGGRVRGGLNVWLYGPRSHSDPKGTVAMTRLDVRPDGTVYNVMGGDQWSKQALGKNIEDFVGPNLTQRAWSTQPGKKAKRYSLPEPVEIGGTGMLTHYGDTKPGADPGTYAHAADKILSGIDPAGYPGRGVAEIGKDISQLPGGGMGGVVLAKGVHHHPFTDKIKGELEKGLPLFNPMAGILGAGVASEGLRRWWEDDDEQAPFGPSYPDL
jgi:hypothetical protein